MQCIPFRGTLPMDWNFGALSRHSSDLAVSSQLHSRFLYPKIRTRSCNRARGRRVTRATDDGLQGARPSQDKGVGKARETMKWGDATVTENRAASADGTMRLLVLSVEDHVDYLEGMKLKRIQKAPRWIDSYKRLAISSSPYEARHKSALLDASIIEVLVERDGQPESEKLAGMSPGDVMQVTQVLGQGFSSLLMSSAGLLSVLEESRPLLMVGVGTNGIAPLRAVLNWPPVQAMTQPISLIYIAENQASAACLQDWDSWRDSGVSVIPVYNESGESPEVLEASIFDRPGGLEGLVGGAVKECGVLMSGLRGSSAPNLINRLRDAGVNRERLMFCEFF